ncbi:MAG TPA: septum formation initiator family protein [Thermoanaerobaculia bacterium]|jgi:cell division protein FtsB|nr:septum formation initiator family protein [Thermoanaerobaculia bacterium]
MTQTEAPVRTDSFRPVLGATVLLVFALLAIAALKSYRDLEAARSRERLLETRIAETRSRSERLRVRIDRLRHDPGMLERLAREDLGLVRPGDVIVELPGEGAMPSKPPKSPTPIPPAPQVVVPVPVQAAGPSPTAGSAGPAEPPGVPAPLAASSPPRPG